MSTGYGAGTLNNDTDIYPHDAAVGLVIYAIILQSMRARIVNYVRLFLTKIIQPDHIRLVYRAATVFTQFK